MFQYQLTAIIKFKIRNVARVHILKFILKKKLKIKKVETQEHIFVV